ncbi:hypothetical protein AQUCO_07300004v1 [Aquilegia coerulea]|uniref:DUF659 domain-containing protein n=1 Tax=Aquilegia coerulea TaxID=218851 RepID=A0A2G5C9U1_AQUCA|nr:hypothetical protein AQUCO_07300004v1 [Aquilegia coerulea]
MCNHVNVYGDEDEVEPIGSNNRPLPKKRKGPMDAFIAPTDVDFVPNVPNTNANKKALENINNYICEFFYDNDIPFYAAKSDSYFKMYRVVVQYNDPLRDGFRVHDATLTHQMLEDVIVNDVGEKNVIQVCMDNASNYKLAGKWLTEKEVSKIYWMSCAAHCLNLMLGDVGKMPLVKETVKDAQKISIFIYNHKHVLHLMRKETKKREILRLSVTRFATTFICLQSMYEKHQQFRDMLRRDNWRRSKWPKTKIAIEIVKKIKSSNLWNNMQTCLKIMTPIVDVLRMVDTEEKPSMAYVYSIKANIGETTLEDRDLWTKMERIVDNKWSDLLQKPLHCAAHYLNPEVYYASVESSVEIEANSMIKKGLLQCIEKLA